MVPRILIFFLGAVVLLVSACANFGHQAAKNTHETTVEKQLLEANQKIAQLDQRVAMLQVMVDNQQRTLYELKKQQAAKTNPVRKTMPVAPRIKIADEPVNKPPVVKTEKIAPTGKTADAHYAAAMAVFRTTDYEKAGNLFDSFVDQFPAHDLADNAMYWSGECRYAQKDFTTSIKRFNVVIEQYPDGGKVPDALLKIALAYQSMGDKEKAIVYLKKVIRSYPFSSAGAIAEEKLKQLQN